MMFPSDHGGGKVFFRRRRHRAVDAWQVHDRDRLAHIRPASPSKHADCDARIIPGAKVSTSQGVHQSRLARIGHAHQTDSQLGSGYRRCLFFYSTMIHAASSLRSASLVPRSTTTSGSPSGAAWATLTSAPGVKPNSSSL